MCSSQIAEIRGDDTSTNHELDIDAPTIPRGLPMISEETPSGVL